MDTKIGEKERNTQNRLIKLFTDKLGYSYIGNLRDKLNNSNIVESLLEKSLKERQHCSQEEIKKAIYQLQQTAKCNNDSLLLANQKVYELLRYGAKVNTEQDKQTQTIHFIDWKNPNNNDFYIAQEVSINGQYDKRPDLLVYVNGIAVAVIELKRSTVSVSEGIRQNIDSQSPEFIRSFFSTIQLICAGNDTEGLMYGVINTPEKFWLRWKEPNPEISNELDRSISQMFSKTRLLEFIHDFMVFDGGCKKTARPNQYFAVKAAQPRVKTKESGIIWQAQGSGKSLIMVWLAQWIHENIDNARVVIITDRDELDKQIEDNFKDAGEKGIERAKSGQNLIDMLNNAAPWLICTLIHKFGSKNTADDGMVYGRKTKEPMEQYLQEAVAKLPEGFQAKGNVFCFVDECHRTQGGYLHEAMRKIMGEDVMLIGFTGTPLLKTDKKTSNETFGSYIHTYKFNEAVEDNVILDLRYEARDVSQYMGDNKKIDTWFETKTRGLNEVASATLKRKWSNLEKLFSSRERIDRIVADICQDMELLPILKDGHANAMLVSDNIYQACRYWNAFQDTDLKDHCAIVTSYTDDISNLKGNSTGLGKTEEQFKYDIYKRMLGQKTPKDFEEYAKSAFVNKPAEMRLLIVVDKLLTGFDAPCATYMYVDKKMQDHNLFQAICRVNRVNGEEKEYGYIIDYQDLFGSITSAISDYTNGAFENLDKEDIEGYMKDRLSNTRQDLDNALEAVKTLCENVNPQTQEGFFKYFVFDESVSDEEREKQMIDNAERRNKLYKLVNGFLIRYANAANDMFKMDYTINEIEDIRKCADDFYNIKREIELKSGDYIDLKKYEPDMRSLLDMYIRANDSEKILDFGENSFIDLVAIEGMEALKKLPQDIRDNTKAVAEILEANVRRIIRTDRPFNPAYFNKLSEILKNLIEEVRHEKITYVEYVKKLIELIQQYKGKEYPQSINSPGKKALFDNLGEDEQFTMEIDKTIHANAVNGFRDGNLQKERQLKQAIASALKLNRNDSKVLEIFNIAKTYMEY
jgi:type I restriction enzyme R subunit